MQGYDRMRQVVQDGIDKVYDKLDSVSFKKVFILPKEYIDKFITVIGSRGINKEQIIEDLDGIDTRYKPTETFIPIKDMEEHTVGDIYDKYKDVNYTPIDMSILMLIKSNIHKYPYILQRKCRMKIDNTKGKCLDVKSTDIDVYIRLYR